MTTTLDLLERLKKELAATPRDLGTRITNSLLIVDAAIAKASSDALIHSGDNDESRLVRMLERLKGDAVVSKFATSRECQVYRAAVNDMLNMVRGEGWVLESAASASRYDVSKRECQRGEGWCRLPDCDCPVLPEEEANLNTAKLVSVRRQGSWTGPVIGCSLRTEDGVVVNMVRETPHSPPKEPFSK